MTSAGPFGLGFALLSLLQPSCCCPSDGRCRSGRTVCLGDGASGFRSNHTSPLCLDAWLSSLSFLLQQFFLQLHPQPKNRLSASLKLQFPGTTTSGVDVSTMHPLDVVVLPNGVRMPRLGFGTASLGEATKRATSWALEAGYRPKMGRIPGRSTRRKRQNGTMRKLWAEPYALRMFQETNQGETNKRLVASKQLHPRHLEYEVTKEQLSTSLRDLGISYLDLFLLHYPRCFSAICHDMKHAGSWQESWKALEELHDELKIRAIGVSNFNKVELQELVALARVKPSVVQRNSDPLNADKETQVLNHPLIQSIAITQACTPAQVVLSWARDKRQVILPRSSNQFCIIGNLEAQHCNLTRLQYR